MNKFDHADFNNKRRADHESVLKAHNEAAAAAFITNLENHWKAIGNKHIADTWTDPSHEMTEQHAAPDVVRDRDGSPCYQPRNPFAMPPGTQLPPPKPRTSKPIAAYINERDQVKIATADEQDAVQKVHTEARRTARIVPLGLLALLVGLGIVFAIACVGGK